jgi:hydrogenase maturation protease
MNLRSCDGPKVLVLGIGNLVMSDDGVGVKVIQHLQREYGFAENVEIMDGGTLGLDLLPKLEGIDHLIVVDAVETGRKPAVRRRAADCLGNKGFSTSDGTQGPAVRGPTAGAFSG